MKTIELTEKDAYVIWSIIAWFQTIKPKPFPHRVMADLYDLTDKTKHAEMEKKYEKAIMTQILETAEFIKKHPEFLEE